MDKTTNRRKFLQKSMGYATFASAYSWTASSYSRIPGANERIRMGLIGAGGMGTEHAQCVRDLSETNNIETVAVADCWLTRANEAAEIMQAPKAYQDYRRVLEHECDYVTIATPEQPGKRSAKKLAISVTVSGKGVETISRRSKTRPKPKGFGVFSAMERRVSLLSGNSTSPSPETYTSCSSGLTRNVYGINDPRF